MPIVICRVSLGGNQTIFLEKAHSLLDLLRWGCTYHFLWVIILSFLWCHSYLSVLIDSKSLFKILESVALFITKPNICLGSFFVQMMKQIPYLQRWILFFVFYICENPHLVLCIGHRSTNERPDASFQVLLLHLMMYDVSTVCKYFGTGFFEQAWYFQKETLKLHINCLSFFKHVPCQIVHIFSYPVAFLPF